MTTTTSTARSTVRLHHPPLAVAGAALVLVLALLITAALALRDGGSTADPPIAPRPTPLVGTADAVERSGVTPGQPTHASADALERRGAAAVASFADGHTYGSSDAAERWTAP